MNVKADSHFFPPFFLLFPAFPRFFRFSDPLVTSPACHPVFYYRIHLPPPPPTTSDEVRDLHMAKSISPSFPAFSSL